MSGRDHPSRALIRAIGGLISKAGVSHDKGDINKHLQHDWYKAEGCHYRQNVSFFGTLDLHGLWT